MNSKYVIGIDLGTTNSVLAYAPLAAADPDSGAEATGAQETGEGSSGVQILPIPQLVAAANTESSNSLPSFLYIPTAHEKSDGNLNLPWQDATDSVTGEMARRQSADVPDRTVGAAKSWLCHTKVDRHQPILPWNAPEDVEKVSPVAASRRYLEHLVAAWTVAHPDAPIEQQVVALTVPASFDAAARELTREAALAAGLPDNLILLEEPQAALYAWLDAAGDDWRKSLAAAETLLVCDVGGGTTDLTLIEAVDQDGELELRRVAVGNHLLVGGDNMDLALAHFVAGKFAEKGTNLDAWQSVSLWHSCRKAKETLLAADADKTSHTISVLGRGSKLIGGTISVEVQLSEVSDLLLNGFLPSCDRADQPVKQRMSGFQEIGLPYEADTAVTKHIAAFLATHAESLPNKILFNGGVFKADAIRSQLLNVIQGWSGQDTAPETLSGIHDLDHAVAKGAAYYALSKQQGGIRIRGGTARSYYIGIETAGLAIPGAPRPLNAICVAPQGMEEGSQLDIPSGEIGLVVGEPAQFRFFSSSTRKEDQPGSVLSRWNEDELVETDSLEATLDADDSTGDSASDGYVPVQFHSHVTELGVFELWCQSKQSDKRWKLEFSVREDA